MTSSQTLTVANTAKTFVHTSSAPLVTRREVLLAVLLCGLASALFLGGVLFTGKYLSPADSLYEDYPWSAQQPAGWPGAANGLLGDDATQFEPWLQYSAQRLRAGEIPLWNPDNMLGAPFVGNMQSAVFYPVNWIYFLFPGALSLGLRAWFKLFVAALGMYLLARKVVGVGPVGAAVASVGFAFGAFMTVWLLHPHTGAACWLPWFWWATAALLERPTPRGLAGVALLVALVALAGHPETAYLVALSTGLFALFRLWRLRSQAVGWRQIARSLGAWVGACLLGACLSAVQILPFLEYLRNSASSILRGKVGAEGFSLPLYYAWTLVSPDLYGNPAHRDWWGPQANYNEANVYCGVVVVLLALFAPLARGRGQRQLAIFLLLLMLAAAAVAFDVPVVRDALVAITFSGTMATQRTTLLAEFSVALLAGIGAHGFQMLLQERRAKQVILYVVGATLLLLCAGVGIPWLAGSGLFPTPGSPQDAAVWQIGLGHALALVLISSAALGLVVAADRAVKGVPSPLLRLAGAPPSSLTLRAATAPVPAAEGAGEEDDPPPESQPVQPADPPAAQGILSWWGMAALWLLPILLFADLFSTHADYLPSIPASQHYPPTGATGFLQSQQARQSQQVQQGQQTQQGQAPFRSIATGRTLEPNTNLMYGLSDVRGYDALEPLPYHNLMLAVDSTIRQSALGGFRAVHSLQSHILDALNVRFVVAAPGENPSYTRDLNQDGNSTDLLTPPIRSGQTAGQTFVARQDNLAQIEVYGVITGTAPLTSGSLTFHLRNVPSDSADLATETLDLPSLSHNGWWQIPFTPVTQAKGKRFYFYFEVSPAAGYKAAASGSRSESGSPSTPGGSPESTQVELEYTQGNPYGGGERMQNGAPASGDLLFDTYSFPDAANPRFKTALQGGAGEASIFEDVRSLPRAWLVHRVEVQTGENNRLGRLADATFDLAGSAMLSAPLPAGFVLPTDTSASREDQVRIVTYRPETVQVATSSRIAGLLVLSDEQFPGWEASVDGQATPILTADEALRAVYVPSGSHTITFSYRPLSFRVGALVSLLSLGLVLVLVLFGWLRPVRRPKQPPRSEIPQSAEPRARGGSSG